MAKKLLIIGAGGHGKVVADLAEQLGWDVAFLDQIFADTHSHLHWPIVGTAEDLERFSGYQLHVAIGDAELRLALLNKARSLGFAMPALIHPSAHVSSLASISDGAVVMAGAIVQAGASIGFGTIINSGAVVDHDCKLASGVHIAPGVSLSGGVDVGEGAWIGTGSSVKQQITIGAKAMIGVGSAVVADIDSGSVAYGVPAVIRS